MVPGMAVQIQRKKVQQPADVEDFEKTLRFVQYVMNESTFTESQVLTPVAVVPSDR